MVAVAALCIACGQPGPSAGGPIQVVAAEGFWGSIAAQLGGSRVSVQSVVTDPNADPHEYESSAADARAFADAGVVVLNGAGYDDWGQKLLDANPAPGRQVLNVAGLLHRKVGDNPHFWYDPGYVVQVADRMTALFRSIDAAGAAYFDQRRSALAVAFEPYLAEIATIKQQHANEPVGSTESIFVYLARALGLDLTTPPAFMDAVAQGSDPPAGAVVAFQDQITGGRLKVIVYNVQTATAVTTAVKDLAAAHHIPTVGISETLQPANASFQDWQLAQLRRLESALQANP